MGFRERAPQLRPVSPDLLQADASPSQSGYYNGLNEILDIVPTLATDKVGMDNVMLIPPLKLPQGCTRNRCDFIARIHYFLGLFEHPQFKHLAALLSSRILTPF
jgi:hypothetical protein